MRGQLSRFLHRGRRFSQGPAVLCFGGVLALATTAALNAQSQFATYDAAGNLTAQLTLASVVAPTIVMPPHGEVGQLGGSVSFSVVATGSAPLTYEWRLNGAPIPVGGNPSAATSTLALNNLTSLSFGNYNVKVTNSSNFVVSIDAALQLDSVGDGIPDQWKATYFGPNWATTLKTGAGEDFDGDGISNREEYIDGTRPDLASSHFYRLVVTQGQVAVSPAGNRFPFNTVVTLTAASVGGSQFVGWTGNVTSTLNPLVLTMTQNYSIGAVSGIFPLDRPALAPSFTTANNASVLQFAVQADFKTLFAGKFDAIAGVPRSAMARLNMDGSLDTSFAPRVTNGTTASGTINAFVVQTDGRIVIGGSFSSVNGVNRFNLARLNSDGTLDATFDAASVVAAGEVRHLQIQPTSGKLVVSNGFGLLVRLTTTGSVDASFVTGSGPNAAVNGIGFQPDGRLIVAGQFMSINGTPRSRIARLNDNGSVDTVGFTATASAGAGPVLVGTGGKIYVCVASAINGTTTALARLNAADGSLDPTFNLPANVSLTASRPGGLSLQANGKLLVAGSIFDSVTLTNLARVNDDGTLDASLAAAVCNGTPSCVTIDGIGKILAGGFFTQVNDESHIRLARFQASNGLIDSAFGTSASGASSVIGIKVMPNGSSIAWGPFTVVNGVACNYLARLNPDGSLDSTFNSGPLGGPGDVVNALVIQPDGKLVVGGSFFSYDSVVLSTPYLLRLNPDGSLDPSLVLPGAGLDDFVSALAIHGDGRILVGGNFSHVDAQNANRLVRLDPLGNVDPSFTAPPLAILQSALPQEITIQAGGGFLLCGPFQVSGSSKTLIRLNDSGSLDLAFPTPTFNGTVRTVLPQPDGRLLVGGDFAFLNGTSIPARGVARLNADGTYDPTFAYNPVAYVTTSVHRMALQSDGSLVVGGGFQTAGNPAFFRLARLDSFGRIDRGFRSDSFPDNDVDAVAFEASGAIIAVGKFANFGPNGRLAYARIVPSTTIQTGTITVTPNQPTYPAGTMVTLSLSPTSSDAPITSVSFESSVDGQNFMPLGPGAPQAGGAWMFNVAGLAPGMSYFRALVTTALAIQTRSNAVGPLRSPPVVTSALTATGAVALPFTYSGTATNPLTSFTATGLPAWADPPVFNPATGILTITGTPTNYGVFYVTLTPTNPAGSTSATLRITVGRSFSDWADANDPGGTPNDDPSGAGVPNGLRYLLGLGVNDPAATRLPRVSVLSLAGGRYLTLTYTRDVAAVSATALVEIVTGLDVAQVWHSGAAYTAEVSRTDNGDGTETVVTRDLIQITVGRERFMRLRATFP